MKKIIALTLTLISIAPLCAMNESSSASNIGAATRYQDLTDLTVETDFAPKIKQKTNIRNGFAATAALGFGGFVASSSSLLIQSSHTGELALPQACIAGGCVLITGVCAYVAKRQNNQLTKLKTAQTEAVSNNVATV